MRAEPPTPPRGILAPRGLLAPRAIAAALLASALVAAAPLAARRTANQPANGTASRPANARATPSAQADQDPSLSAVVRPAEAAELASLPEGPGKTLVAERCLLCHSAGLIVRQRKDAAAWGRTVTQMRTWGSPIKDADQTALVTYLTDHFGPAAQRR